MSDIDYSKTVKRMKTVEEIVSYMAGFREGTRPHLAAKYEIERRRLAVPTRQSWIAIGIAVLSLIVSLLVAFLK